MQKLIPVCPQTGFTKTCREVNTELQKQGKQCAWLTTLTAQAPDGSKQNTLICSIEATTLIVSNANQKLDVVTGTTGNRPPKLYLPGPS